MVTVLYDIYIFDFLHILVLTLSIIKVMFWFCTCLNSFFYFSVALEHWQEKVVLVIGSQKSPNRYLPSGRFPLIENMFSYCFLCTFQIYQWINISFTLQGIKRNTLVFSFRFTQADRPSQSAKL